jgi:hypothetical protein
MKVIWDVLLLVGLIPGTVLPSFLTDQLIAPAAISAEAREGDQSTETGPGSGSPSEDSDAAIGTPSVYSALRPATFPYSKGDLRSINRSSECPAFTIPGVISNAPASALIVPISVDCADEITCKTRQPGVIIPAHRAHAPPRSNPH